MLFMQICLFYTILAFGLSYGILWILGVKIE